MASDDVTTAPAEQRDLADLTPPPVRKRPAMSTHLVDWLGNDWEPAPRMAHPAEGSGVSAHTAARRAALSEHFAGQLIVVPSGLMRTRANDTQYPFRASSAFVWLTGETVEGAVLVMAPRTVRSRPRRHPLRP